MTTLDFGGYSSSDSGSRIVAWRPQQNADLDMAMSMDEDSDIDLDMDAPIDYTFQQQFSPPIPHITTASLEMEAWFAAFLTSYLPRHVVGVPTHAEANFCLEVYSRPFRSAALRAAITAVGTAHMASVSGDAGLAVWSRRQYCHSLKQMQIALDDPWIVKQEDTVCAGIFLEVYEMLECSTGTQDGWMSHVRGSMRLIKNRGIEGLRTRFGRTMYNSVRFEAVSPDCSLLRYAFTDPPRPAVPPTDIPRRTTMGRRQRPRRRPLALRPARRCPRKDDLGRRGDEGPHRRGRRSDGPGRSAHRGEDRGA
ncbi:hypothetical protein MRB53_037538 [Persea americana]|nr:hypothetical protein MRB53_037538 [Persea americana]